MSFSNGPAGQPLGNKRQSPFHQFSPHIAPPFLFYSSCLLPLCFCFGFFPSIPHFHSVSVPLRALGSPPLGRHRWRLLLLPLCELLKVLFKSTIQTFLHDCCMCGCFLFADMRAERESERERESSIIKNSPPSLYFLLTTTYS